MILRLWVQVYKKIFSLKFVLSSYKLSQMVFLIRSRKNSIGFCGFRICEFPEWFKMLSQLFTTHYRPPMKMREGNVFTRVCMSDLGGMYDALNLTVHNATAQTGTTHSIGMHFLSLYFFSL